MKKALIITAIVLVVVGVAVFFIAFAVAGNDLTKLGSVKTETNTYEVEGSFDKIDIQTKESDVEFLLAEDGKAKVVCVERQTAKHVVNIDNGALKVNLEDKTKWIERLGFFKKNLSMSVYLPAAYYSSLTLNASTGDISIPEVFSFGEINIKASTGDVTCAASANGNVAITTSTGDIKVDKIGAKNLSLTVSTGDVEVVSSAIEETLSISVDTGKTTLTDVTSKDLVHKGSTGKVNLKNAVCTDGIKIEVSTGDVNFDNCDAYNITVKASTGDVKGTIRTGKTFVVTSSTGKTRVPASTEGGKCEISTSTGDIDIKITGV